MSDAHNSHCAIALHGTLVSEEATDDVRAYLHARPCMELQELRVDADDMRFYARMTASPGWNDGGWGLIDVFTGLEGTGALTGAADGSIVGE